MAQKRLNILEKRMDGQRERTSYITKIKDYILRGYIKKMTNEDALIETNKTDKVRSPPYDSYEI